jgi:uracil-DNA glycosylase
MTTFFGIERSWYRPLACEFAQPYMAPLQTFVHAEYQAQTIYPPQPHIFRAFDACPFEAVKVVILGQDPYHGPGQANGLCFAVNAGMPPPPSLKNIFKELDADMGTPVLRETDLSRWAQQGVLLLNATLTVRAGAAGSHQGKGWEQFTDAAIAALARERHGLVFLLWGNSARKKAAGIDLSRHLVLESAHPSPLSAHNGFFGCRHFSKANAYLASRSHAAIVW